ncbi:MAG TPA: diaminopimelate epimerase [Blastocatellia bacterium]|nr:diaminopimelate epimerase [Blastocatellia bacterium]
MSSIDFCKFHGFGNDYIVIERGQIPDSITDQELALKICDRKTGVGSDGIAIIEKLEEEKGDFRCQIVNPDGSIAPFSGNGTRCAVAYLYYRKMWRYPSLKLETLSGIKNYTLIERETEGHYWFEADIGRPKFAGSEIPILLDGHDDSVIERPFMLSGAVINVSAVNVGNPVAGIFVDDFDFDWRSQARELEVHDAFPENANVVYIKVLDRENIEIRIWERGAGHTISSGTAASGAAVLSVATGRADRTISVNSEGGTTEIYWRPDDNIMITGRADLAFCGDWPL